MLETIHAMEAAYDARDPKKLGALYTDKVDISFPGRGDLHDRASAEESFGHFFAAFGGIQLRAGRVFTKGDVAIAEWTMTASHDGAFVGIEPSHARVGWRGADVITFASDGRIRVNHRYWDVSTLVAQSDKPRAPDAREIPEARPLEHIAAGGTKDEDANLAALDRINKVWEKGDEAG
jgi:hypothetical protein